MDVAVVSTATLVAGSFIGWGVAKAAMRSRTSEEGVAARAERDSVMADRDQLRNELASAATERDRLREALDVSSNELLRVTVDLTKAQTLLKSQEQVEAALQQSFARMSTEALQTNRQELLNLADDRFRQAGRPLTETLGRVETQLREIEKERASAQRELAQQIQFVRSTGEQLKSETAALVNALRKPQARGQWGELTLRRCLEHAGMLDRSDFVEQATISTADGSLRPDLVIRLVGGKNLVVDAKVTLAAFLEAYEANDDATREERLAAHARHLRQHVDNLASKAYWEHLSPAPEFVVLFVPGDAFLATALDYDATLLEDSLRKRVHIATPTTLISILRTVAYSWQQDALASNAQEVFDLGKELYSRIVTFSGHMTNVGGQLSKSVTAYNNAVKSLEGRLLVTARRFKDLDLVDQDIAEVNAIDESVVSLSKPELVDHGETETHVIAIGPSDRLEDYGLNAANDLLDEWRTG